MPSTNPPELELPSERRRGLTEVQIAFYNDQMEKAVEKASKNALRRALIGYVILLVAIAAVYYTGSQQNLAQRAAVIASGTVVAVDGCNRDFRSTESVRGVLIEARRLVQEGYDEHTLIPDRAERLIDFYDRQIEQNPLPDCRLSKEILTSNPDEVPDIPTPLFPTGRQERAGG